MKFSAIFVIVSLAIPCLLSAQEDKAAGADILDRDLDSLFDEPLPDSGGMNGPAADDPGSGAGVDVNDGNRNTGDTGSILSSMIRRRGFTLDASYYFYGGVSPGWSEAPWHWNDGDEEYSTVLGAGISAALGLDFQISEYLRVKNLFTFVFPGMAFTVKEVFLDYNLKDRVFFRGGKFIQNWGISPHYPYSNLLARLPSSNSGGSPGDPYIVKIDVPIGIGGVELLALTRPGFMTNPALPSFDEIGFGGKYNLAYRQVDVDVGVFYHEKMPLRNFVSVKSTVMDTEIYAEALVSVRHKPWGTLQGSGSVGFMRDFFSGKLTLGGEYFYNGEKDTVYFNPETNLEEAEVVPFVNGNNMAMNILYRTGVFKDLRLAAQCLYSFDENSAVFVPGLSFAPFPHINVSLGVPMALGSRDGTYYRRNADKNNRPFSIVMLVSISGDYRFTYAP
jgi:hypothetical protein